MNELILTPTPQLTVLSGPMGGGKSRGNRAIIEGLQNADIQTWGQSRVMSISDTTRGRREEMGEPEDAYNFLQPTEKFETALETGKLMEKTYHSGTHYGSPTPPEGQPTHFEIEVSGVRQIMESDHPRVIEAREGLLAAYLLQDSMDALFEQIMGRNDGMSAEKKIERISRYPAEILYILERGLPYSFILNPFGRSGFMETQLVKYMLRDPEAILQSERLAEIKAKEALRWLLRIGVEPAPVNDPADS